MGLELFARLAGKRGRRDQFEQARFACQAGGGGGDVVARGGLPVGHAGWYAAG